MDGKDHHPEDSYFPATFTRAAADPPALRSHQSVAANGGPTAVASRRPPAFPLPPSRHRPRCKSGSLAQRRLSPQPVIGVSQFLASRSALACQSLSEARRLRPSRYIETVVALNGYRAARRLWLRPRPGFLDVPCDTALPGTRGLAAPSPARAPGATDLSSPSAWWRCAWPARPRQLREAATWGEATNPDTRARCDRAHIEPPSRFRTGASAAVLAAGSPGQRGRTAVAAATPGTRWLRSPLRPPASPPPRRLCTRKPSAGGRWPSSGEPRLGKAPLRPALRLRPLGQASPSRLFRRPSAPDGLARLPRSSPRAPTPNCGVLHFVFCFASSFRLLVLGGMPSAGVGSRSSRSPAEIMHYLSIRQEKRRSEVAALRSGAGWWELNCPTNLITVENADHFKRLMSSLSESNELVVVDFFAPWCRACRTLFPKLSQIASNNPEVHHSFSPGMAGIFVLSREHSGDVSAPGSYHIVAAATNKHGFCR